MILRLTIFLKIHDVVVCKVNKRLLKSNVFNRNSFEYIHTYMCARIIHIYKTGVVSFHTTVPTRTNSNVIGTTGNLGDVFY